MKRMTTKQEKHGLEPNRLAAVLDLPWKRWQKRAILFWFCLKPNGIQSRRILSDFQMGPGKEQKDTPSHYQRGIKGLGANAAVPAITGPPLLSIAMKIPK